MRLFAQLTSFVLLMGSVLLSQTPCIFAQGQRPDPAAIATDVLPDVPEPQNVSTSVERSDEQPSAGQSRSDAGENGQEGRKAQHPAALDPSNAGISGTVTDTNGNVVSGATVVLEGPHAGDRRSASSSDNGSFQFDGLKAGIPYRVTIEVKDLDIWKSKTIVLDPGQYFFMMDIKLRVSNSVTSVTVYATQEQIATQQVLAEVQQRVFGIIPNFYVTYDPHPVPLTTKLKFKLAYKANTDVMTFVGVAFMAGVYQAGDVPDYGQGAKGYGQRVGAGLADTTTDIFIGGAILPWLLHQDPRYFYQGTGTKKSRALHAIAYPYVCKGDNGKSQPNYSSLGGDLASGAISNLYYPESNRGVGLVFEGFLITTGVRTVNAVLQEFVIRKLTPSARVDH